MKKLILLLLAVMMTVTVRAYDYPYLTFQATDGTLTSVSVESLSISVSGSQLICTNSAGTQTFTLSQLSKMYFSTSDVTTGIISVNADEPSEVEVFTVSGISMGTFSSLGQATATLKPGVYVIKTDSGTIKIAVK